MTSPQTLSDFVHQAVLPHLAAGAVYRSVHFVDTGGRFWRGTCPFHADDPSSCPMYVDWVTLRWSCLDGCRKGGQSFLAFLNKGRFPQPGSGELRAALHLAADLAGLPQARVPECTAEDELRAIQDERVASLLETFFLQARWALHAEPASPGPCASAPARAWLVDQGFDPASLGDLPIGLFVEGEAIRRGLLAAGFTVEEIEASALAADPRLVGRLVGPIRDRWGRIRSFWARHPDDRPPKFLFKGQWKEEVGLFGLDAALHPAAGERGDLIVVERLLDALLLQSRGLRNVAAVGGPPRELGKRRWQRLWGLGVRRLILAFEPAAHGSDGILAALQSAFRVRHTVEEYVLLPKSLRGYSSLAELTRAKGLAALQAIFETEPVHAYSFKASSLLDRHRTGRGWTDAGRHAAWKEAIEFYVSQGRHAVDDLDRHFVPTMVAGLERTWDAFQPLPGFQREPEPPERPVDDSGETGVVQPGPSAPKRPTETCPVHRCGSGVCFCFD